MKDETEEVKNDVVVETTTDKNENPEAKEVVTTENVSTEQVQPTAQEMAFAFLKENGIEANSIEDLKRQPEKVVEKVEFNPYEDVLDDDDKAYLNFKKETGRSRKEYEALNTNLDELPKIDLAREMVKKEAGINMTDKQADDYIASKLEIIDLDNMSFNEEIELAKFTKSLLDEKKAEQEKYRKPIAVENKTAEQANQDKQEYVKLDNGAVMLKSDYDKLADSRLKEIESAKVAVNSVTASTFNVTFDDNGTNVVKDYTYEYSEEDKHSMLSIVSDIDKVVKDRYHTENGFNHKQFAEDMQWSDLKFREKALASIIHKAVANGKEELLKERGNVNFTNQESLQKNIKDGVTMKSFREILKDI